jgi:hypothetical protein
MVWSAIDGLSLMLWTVFVLRHSCALSSLLCLKLGKLQLARLQPILRLLHLLHGSLTLPDGLVGELALEVLKELRTRPLDLHARSDMVAGVRSRLRAIQLCRRKLFLLTYFLVCQRHGLEPFGFHVQLGILLVRILPAIQPLRLVFIVQSVGLGSIAFLYGFRRLHTLKFGQQLLILIEFPTVGREVDGRRMGRWMKAIVDLNRM